VCSTETGALVPEVGFISKPTSGTKASISVEDTSVPLVTPSPDLDPVLAVAESGAFDFLAETGETRGPRL